MGRLFGIGMMVLCIWSCERETVRMSGYDVQGIDVSHYQSLVNWDTVAAQDITFAFVKATEGFSYRDSMFCQNWSEMQRVGLKRGAYHFFHPSIPADLQARNFMQAVELGLGDLPPVLDVEVLEEGVSKVALLASMRHWLYLVEIKYNIKPIIYTNLVFYNKYLAGHFKDYPLWIARYGRRQPTLACGRDWSFWQYGSAGKLRGIQGAVDFNVFNGDMVQLEELCINTGVVVSEAGLAESAAAAGQSPINSSHDAGASR